MDKRKVKRQKISGSSDPTDSDAGKYQEPSSGDTKSQRNAGIGQTQENPERKDIKKVDADKICQLDSQKFEEIRKTILFVDKTEFIYDVFHAEARRLHLLAPRRFGKSTFLDTIHSFVSIKMNENNEAIPNREDSENYKLFMDLKVGQKHPEFVKQNCGLYPVIRVSFENVRVNDMERVQASVKTAIHKAFKFHEYLVQRGADGKWAWKNGKLFEKGKDVDDFLNYYDKKKLNKLNSEEVINGLLQLAELLHIHFGQKVVILIDECDTPIMKAVQKGKSDEIVKETIDLVGDLLKTTLKGEDVEDHIRLGVLTSCTRVPGVFTWELNNLKEFYFLAQKRFCKLFGFTREEVEKITSDSRLKSICDEALIDQFESIRDMDGINDWYDGYEPLHDKKESIYCSYSLLNYLPNSIQDNEPLFDAYWAGGGYLATLGRLFQKQKIREPIQKLLDGESYGIKIAKVTIENILKLRDTMLATDELTTQQVDFFLQLLSDDGVLNTIHKEKYSATLIIPNYENKIMIECNCYTQEIFEDVYRMKPENMTKYVDALKCLLRKPCEEACKQLANAISMLFSGDALMPANETEFNAPLYNLLGQHLTFGTQSNRPAEGMEEKVTKEKEESEPEVASKPSRRNPGRVCKSKFKHDLDSRSKRGRKKEFDILVTMGTAGAIFELKYNHQSAQQALDQIHEKHYFKAFEKKEHAGVTEKIYIGLHMDKERKVTICAQLNGLEGETVQVTSDDYKC